jgi:hypothetical protein
MRKVRQGAEGLVDIGVRTGNAHLVEVDPVGLKPPQTLPVAALAT